MSNIRNKIFSSDSDAGCEQADEGFENLHDLLITPPIETANGSFFRRAKYFLLSTTISAMLIGTGAACEYSWVLPKGPMPGVDERGVAMFALNLANVKLASGTVIPLTLKFRADDHRADQIAGRGWIVSLLESQIVQISENEFMFEEPNGWRRTFVRNSPNSSMLVDHGGWRGEIKGDLITLTADCGISATFQKGKISTLTIGSDELKFEYQDGQLIGVTQNQKYLIRVARTSPDETDLHIAEGIITLNKGERPIVSRSDHINVVSRLDSSLIQVSGLTNRTEIGYPIDDMSYPGISIKQDFDGPRDSRFLATWNPTSGWLKTLDDWSYAIQDTSTEVQIARSLGTNSNEYWKRSKDGTQISISKLGFPVRKITRFGSGLNYGKTRSIEYTYTNGTEEVRRFSYDEKGDLARVMISAPSPVVGGRDVSYERVISSKQRKIVSKFADDQLQKIEKLDKEQKP